ncbi:MAG: sigma-54 dependent transcriptional regulator [Thermoanaerobaculales bacterium]|nr:sigma-54 dependent transcriptional regulator [Thermoanaerobaculales bacterium]
MASSFPDLVELFPLCTFIEALLEHAEKAAGTGPVACHVPFSRQIAVRRQGRTRVETIDEDLNSQLFETLQSDVVEARHLRGAESCDVFADFGTVRSAPCTILSRPVGFLLTPGSNTPGPRLQFLARLAGYYLHRHEIEVSIERLGAKVMIMGCSPAMFRLQEAIERFSPLREPVLILGESGSGKEIFAQAVHVLSPRRNGPFVSVNCGATPSDNLLQDEFFGHERGAFTGAMFAKEGCCRQAHGGSLFLDEIGEMSHEMQTLLLRTLTTGEVRRIGSQSPTTVDIRIISATHKDLHEATGKRTFRRDLYYRISPFQIHVPPLRDRRADIRHLARYFLFHFAEVNRLPSKYLTPAAVHALEQRYSWPGNVRELENLLMRAFVTAPGTEIDVEHLEPDSGEWHPSDVPHDLLGEIRDRGQSFWEVIHGPFMRRELRRDEVAQVIHESLGRCGGRLKALAAYLNLPPEDYARFVSFLHRHGLRFRDLD